MNKTFKILNNVKTELLIWENPFSANAKEVIICITGNPGVPHFYIDFASKLYKDLNLPICVIGHAGHGDIYNDKFHVLTNQNNKFFDLKAQLKHKLDLLENEVSHASKIHLIGHSIGAWMIIELLHNKDHLREKVASINLLFPTIQRMAESKNGKFLNNVLRRMYWILLILCHIIYLIPTWAFRYIVNLYLMLKSLPYSYCDAVLKLINPFVIKNILVMAFDEMDTVQKLNSDGIQNIKHLTNVIYGSHDAWAPLEYMKDLKKYEPDIQLREAHDIEHAFVLKSSENIADMVASFISSSSKLN